MVEALDRLREVNSFDTREEAEALWRLAQGRRVLEIGSFLGFTALVFALGGAEHVDAIDPHVGDSTLGPQDTLPTMWANLGRFGVRERVTIHVGPAHGVVLGMLRHQFGLVFIDGNHLEAVEDTQYTLPLLQPGGLLVWHDRDDWEVPRAIDWARRETGRPVELLAGRLAMIRLP